MTTPLTKAESRRFIELLKPKDFSEPEETKLILKHLLYDPRVGSAPAVGLYAAMQGEPNIETLATEFGERAHFPAIEADQIVYRQESLPQELVKGAFGFRQPAASKKKVELWPDHSVLLIPGVAFDKLGTRLGRGKGHYDKYLANISGNILKIGIAYGYQLVSQALPKDTWDIAMDAICTPRGIFMVRRES